VETDWLRDVLRRNGDASHKLVVGHHPVFPVNGYPGAYQREVGPECAMAFWNALVEGKVLAYLCSHILAFDVQVNRGVLQVCTAGAGIAHRMPEGVEYLHFIQAAVDAGGLRYQVIDVEGRVREQLTWPFMLPPNTQWHALRDGEHDAEIKCDWCTDRIVALRFAGHAAPVGSSAMQTLLTAFDPGAQPQLWIGLRGPEQRLTVTISGEPRRSPHYGNGPAVVPGEAFDFQLLFHTGMGPGGIMSRLLTITARHLLPRHPGEPNGWSGPNGGASVMQMVDPVIGHFLALISKRR
jgi:hypothetical protein